MGIENLLKVIRDNYATMYEFAMEYAMTMESEYSDSSYYEIIETYGDKFDKLMENLENYLKNS